jgi:hypothetical protein
MLNWFLLHRTQSVLNCIPTQSVGTRENLLAVLPQEVRGRQKLTNFSRSCNVLGEFGNRFSTFSFRFDINHVQ